ncbi:hypothetical protein NL676_007339 [Syzygium grande]|nr:hypothetical protein NL676_007339 [Syzygium grande]
MLTFLRWGGATASTVIPLPLATPFLRTTQTTVAPSGTRIAPSTIALCSPPRRSSIHCRNRHWALEGRERCSKSTSPALIAGAATTMTRAAATTTKKPKRRMPWNLRPRRGAKNDFSRNEESREAFPLVNPGPTGRKEVECESVAKIGAIARLRGGGQQREERGDGGGEKEAVGVKEKK